MPAAAIEDPRNIQEELGQFLTASPVADFMASMFGPLPGATRRTLRDRWGLLVKAEAWIPDCLGFLAKSKTPDATRTK